MRSRRYPSCLMPLFIRPLSVFLIFFAVTAYASRVQSAEWDYPSLHLGLNTGYSSLSGYYKSDLEDSMYLGLSFIPLTSKYLLGEVDVTYSAYELSNSEGSNLYSVSVNAGPLFNLPLFRYVSLYAGLLARGNYFYLNAQNLDRQENTFKPGFSARTGAFISLPLGMRLRAGIDYSQVWLSGTPFRSLNYYGGISYNLLHVSSAEVRFRKETQDELKRYSQIDKNYNSGVKHFNEGELKSARENFVKVLALKSDHRESRAYMDKIVDMEYDFARAREYLDNKNFIAAIPHLSRAEANMKEARSALAEVRAKLAPLVPDMERRGIQAYDGNNYELCIDLMNRVRLIDPDNRSAKIYLPRAIRRHEALKKLK